MNLFDTIGLKADPFSTSPNVDLFYPAAEHRQCLEGLELAVRMRRGLSVVRGGIGVGKTTISRKLIQNFKDESDDFIFHLILDPKFESEIILLKHIIELFGINESAESVQDCRNIIENYLLKVGVDQGKTLVLIVDEGQNLPGEMLDVFRTLLNFETDEFKLLQLIIFGQPEIGKIIKEYPNFEDRIIFNFELGPISLEDTKGMIEHRIIITGGESPKWFSNEAIIKIHKNTQGFPRKITQLCHQSLLAMMSEKKETISEEMINRVLSGKVDTSGLLKQTKSNYNDIAVNKLLDVLQKDEPEDSKKEEKSFDNLADEDDWIGTDDSSMERPEEKVLERKSLSKKNESIPLNNKPEKKTEPVNPVPEREPQVLSNNQINETKKIELEDQFIPNQGRHNPSIKNNIVSKLPFDKIYIGLHIDFNQVITVAIEESKSRKTLLAYDIYSYEAQEFDFENDFEKLVGHFPDILNNLIEQLSDYGSIYQSAIKTLKQKNAIALTIDHNNISSHIVNIPKEGEKEKNQIINWSLSKVIKFPIEEAIISSKKANNQNYYASVGHREVLDKYGECLQQNELSIRKWYPISQAIHNSFLWNYHDRRNKTTIIIHIGEKNGVILGCEKGEIKVIQPLYLGLLGLFDALKDNGIYENKTEKKHRNAFQVPEALLSTVGDPINRGEYDDIFRSVFENWIQEIDRTINGMRKDLKFTNDTKILLSGSTGYILYLDNLIETVIGIKTIYMNPLRNLNITTEFDINSLSTNPSIFTASIGSGIAIDNSPSILPKQLKQNEIFRWMNRGGLIAAAVLVFFCVGLSIQKKVMTESIINKMDPMIVQKNSLDYVEDKHKRLENNTTSVKQQIKKLSYDTEYSNRVLAVNRILSFYTPKEIKISLVKFQKGWDVKGYKKVGRDLVPVVQKKDEHLRIVRLTGSVSSNSALLENHFNNFVAMLEETNLFQTIDIIEQSSKERYGPEFLQFDLKCVL